MYRNFSISEKEKQQILESHKKHGYKKPLNEQGVRTDNGGSAYEQIGVMSEKMDELDYRINDTISEVIKMEDEVTNLMENNSGELSENAMDTLDEIVRELKRVTDKMSYGTTSTYEMTKILKNLSNPNNSDGEVETLNELGEKDIDLIRGIPDFKTKSGKPVGDYVGKRNASRQFQHDFGKDFADPSDEYTPHWEKDRPNPSNDSEIETDIRTNIKQANRELTKQPEKDTVSQDREERIKLRRKIASLVSHKEEFGGDEELDRVIERLRAQAREMDDNNEQPFNEQEQTPTQSTNIGLKQVAGILKSKGFTMSSDGSYKLLMVKNSNGPVQNKDGSYVWNYEAYVPSNPGNQLWIGKRRKDIKNPDGVPESSYVVINLNGPTHKILSVKNGKTVNTQNVDTQTAMNFINSYQAKF